MLSPGVHHNRAGGDPALAASASARRMAQPPDAMSVDMHLERRSSARLDCRGPQLSLPRATLASLASLARGW
eukprot:1985432-Pyramimonas_sp.AAC.1